MSPRSTTLPHRHAFTPESSPRSSSGFTIIELLVVVSIIALLIGILLPAISKARDSAKVTESLANLRNLAAAHQSYAAEWNDRQFTLVRDNLGLYSNMEAYEEENGDHPNIILGYGFFTGGTYGYVYYDLSDNGADLAWPIKGTNYYGWFRMINCRNFNTYVGGRFYDKTFYAPKDRVVTDVIGEHFDGPGEFGGFQQGQDPYFSSYVMSPAALFAPNVFNAKGCTLGVQSFASMGGGAFRCPSMSQARYPSLKTHMLEHHWLQNSRGLSCNPGIEGGTYDGCEPYFFNLSIDSAPATMFFDGSVRTMGTREAASGDQAVRGAPGAPPWAGLYFRPSFDELPFAGAAGSIGQDGYYLPAAYDTESFDYETGYHILTKDGILGRDTLGGT